MRNTVNETAPEPQDDAESRAEEQEPELGVLREFLEFMRYNKKWWLIPIIVVLLLVTVLVVLSGTAAAPFIYTLF